jgi:hypothetical protein
MRWWWLLAIGGLAWLVLRPGAAPAWYRDLMLRGYAGDQVPDATKPLDATVAEVALTVDLPLAWVQLLAVTIPAAELDAAARKVKAAILTAGAPADTSASTLAAYKSAALAAALGLAGAPALSPTPPPRGAA